jgi:uncharacterized protein (DUF427 family)
MSLIEETTSSEMDLPIGDTAALDIRADPMRVRAMFAGHVIADSDQVLILRRRGLPDLRFFPRDDIEMSYLGETGQILSDPDLGEATCYTCVMDGQIVERAVCAFDSPPRRAERLTGRLCLAEGVFEIYELTERDLAMAPRAAQPHGNVA